MDIEFWGVRGTAPVSGKGTEKYGGRTPCASIVSSAGDIVIIDAGTGIKRLGESLMARPEAAELRLHLLFTHFHLDHLIGLPFFAPLYAAGAMITFYSPLPATGTQRHLRGLMSGPYFPVDFQETGSAKTYAKIGQDPLTIGRLEVAGCPLNHPQGCFGYRISDRGGSIVFATDTEPPEAGLDERLAGFLEGSDIFVSDATFTPAEYATRQGWGHSTWLDGVRLARRAGVADLLLSHLNPDHTDAQVDDWARQAKREFRGARPAREGLRLSTAKSPASRR